MQGSPIRIGTRASFNASADTDRRLSARSISPSALLDEGPQLDPLMPVVARGPAVVQDVSREQQQRTKFPVI
jgi:hypothetical protein